MERYSYGMISLEDPEKFWSKEPRVRPKEGTPFNAIDWTYKDCGLFVRSEEVALHFPDKSDFQDAVKSVTAAAQKDFDTIEDLLPEFMKLFEDSVHADCIRWVVKPQELDFHASSYEFLDQMNYRGNHPFSRLGKLRAIREIERGGDEKHLKPFDHNYRDLVALSLPMGIRNIGHGDSGYTEGRTLRDAAEAALAIYKSHDTIKEKIPILM
jgi:hypothetical protein